MKPIGFFKSEREHRFEAPRQPPQDRGTSEDYIELEPGQNFEQALIGLESFSHIWVLFQFHKNENWKPMVKPPRLDQKMGVFATRSPHRPNAIGLSCLELHKVEGRKLFVGSHDLLDGSPILDLKPYLPSSDSWPHAKAGWTETLQTETWTLQVSDLCERQLLYLESQGLTQIRSFLQQQLSENPLDQKRKRIEFLQPDQAQISYRTWRVHFQIHAEIQRLSLLKIESGYSAAELSNDFSDPYLDKALHKSFLLQFPRLF